MREESRPLMMPTTERKMREKARPKATKSRALLTSTSAPAWPMSRWSTIYCCNLGGTSSAMMPIMVRTTTIKPPRQCGARSSHTRPMIFPF
jgi:hypothetical protein